MKHEEINDISTILIEAGDERTTVMSQIRKQSKTVVIVLPEQDSPVFQQPSDFYELKRLKRERGISITLVIAGHERVRHMARRQGFAVYSSTETCARAIARRDRLHAMRGLGGIASPYTSGLLNIPGASEPEEEPDEDVPWSWDVKFAETPDGIPSGTPHGISDGLPHGTPHGISDGIPSGTPHGTPQGPLQPVRRSLLERVDESENRRPDDEEDAPFIGTEWRLADEELWDQSWSQGSLEGRLQPVRRSEGVHQSGATDLLNSIFAAPDRALLDTPHPTGPVRPVNWGGIAEASPTEGQGYQQGVQNTPTYQQGKTFRSPRLVNLVDQPAPARTTEPLPESADNHPMNPNHPINPVGRDLSLPPQFIGRNICSPVIQSQTSIMPSTHVNSIARVTDTLESSRPNARDPQTSGNKLVLVLTALLILGILGILGFGYLLTLMHVDLEHISYLYHFLMH